MKSWFHGYLVSSTAPDESHDLGVIQAKDREDAHRMFTNRYARLMKRMQTGTYTIDVRVGAARERAPRDMYVKASA